MGKTIRAFLALLCCAALVIGFGWVGSVRAEDALTFVSATAISESQIILEFSAPVAVNFNGSNSGPYTALRLVADGDELVWDNATPMQATGSLMYVDANHDRLVWTLGETLGGEGEISKILAKHGDLASFGGIIKFCIEEIPYSKTEGLADGLLENVTNADGSVKLTASKINSWDGVYLPVTVDFDAAVDLSASEGLEKGVPSKEDNSFTMKIADSGIAPAEDKNADGPNMALIIGLLAGAVLICTAFVIIAAVSVRRNKAGKASK